jgi:hypothetical protein
MSHLFFWGVSSSFFFCEIHSWFWWGFFFQWYCSSGNHLQNMKVENLKHFSIFLAHFGNYLFIYFELWWSSPKTGNFRQEIIFSNIFQRMATFHYKKKSLVDFTFKNVIFKQVFAFILQCLIFGFFKMHDIYKLTCFFSNNMSIGHDNLEFVSSTKGGSKQASNRE